jgi:hypothetical protein
MKKENVILGLFNHKKKIRNLTICNTTDGIGDYVK